MDKLPNEILLIIFSYITPHQLDINAANVCCRWRRLILLHVLRIHYPPDKEKLHKDLQALLVTSYIPVLPNPSKIISHVMHITSCLKHLTLSIEYSLNDTDFKSLEKINSLRHLDIFSNTKILNRNTTISSKITSFVANEVMGLWFLQHLTARNVINAFHMYGRSIFYPEDELTGFLKKITFSLRELTLRCSNLEENRYMAIGMCEGLTSLQLYNCVHLTYCGVCHITRLSKLRRLHLTGTKWVLSDDLLRLIRDLPRGIEELNLSCTRFGDEHCAPLVNRLPNLRHLELWRCRVSMNYLTNLATTLTSLEKLDTDVKFNPENLQLMGSNPSLMSVRCLWEGAIETRLNMSSALENVPCQFLRGDDEGPQSNLFYYWTQGVSLDSLSVPNPSVYHPIAIPKSEYRSMKLIRSLCEIAYW